MKPHYSNLTGKNVDYFDVFILVHPLRLVVVSLNVCGWGREEWKPTSGMWIYCCDSSHYMYAYALYRYIWLAFSPKYTADGRVSNTVTKRQIDCFVFLSSSLLRLLGRIKALHIAIRNVKSETPMLQDSLISVCTRVQAITRLLSRETTSQEMLAVKKQHWRAESERLWFALYCVTHTSKCTAKHAVSLPKMTLLHYMTHADCITDVYSIPCMIENRSADYNSATR